MEMFLRGTFGNSSDLVEMNMRGSAVPVSNSIKRFFSLTSSSTIIGCLTSDLWTWTERCYTAVLLVVAAAVLDSFMCIFLML